MFKNVDSLKSKRYLRLAITGPAGAGKTYTALKVAKFLPFRPIAVIDTEAGGTVKYRREFQDLDWDVLILEDDFHPNKFTSAIREAEKRGYQLLIIDSLSSAYDGPGGIRDIADQYNQRIRSSNTMLGWAHVEPVYRNLMNAIRHAKLHIIVTFRVRMKVEMDRTDEGKLTVRKVGLEPIFKKGEETAYEFDIVADMDIDNRLTCEKTRCSALKGKIFQKPGEGFAQIIGEWLSDAQEKPVEAEAEAEEVEISAEGPEQEEIVNKYTLFEEEEPPRDPRREKIIKNQITPLRKGVGEEYFMEVLEAFGLTEESLWEIPEESLHDIVDLLKKAAREKSKGKKGL